MMEEVPPTSPWLISHYPHRCDTTMTTKRDTDASSPSSVIVDTTTSGAVNTTPNDEDDDKEEDVLIQAVYRLMIQQQQLEASHEQLAWIVLHQQDDLQTQTPPPQEQEEKKQLNDLRAANQSLIEKCNALIQSHGDLLHMLTLVAAKQQEWERNYQAQSDLQKRRIKSFFMIILLTAVLIVVLNLLVRLSNIESHFEIGESCFLEDEYWYKMYQHMQTFAFAVMTRVTTEYAFIQQFWNQILSHFS
jgi:hypothetical protein